MTTRATNISGKTYGLWSVICRAPNRSRSSAAVWVCRCKCGEEKHQDGHTLRSGKSKGCRSCTRKIRPYEAIYNLLVNGAKLRGLELSITYEDYVKFTENGSCHYCGSSIQWIAHSISRNGQNYNLDRMDSSKGYHTWNCVQCCSRCNQTKSNLLSYDEMVVVGNMRRTS